MHKLRKFPKNLGVEDPLYFRRRSLKTFKFLQSMELTLEGEGDISYVATVYVHPYRLILGVFDNFAIAQTAILIYIRLAVRRPVEWFHTAQCLLANKGIAINRWDELQYHLCGIYDLVSNRIYEVHPYHSLTLNKLPRKLVQYMLAGHLINLYILAGDYPLD